MLSSSVIVGRRQSLNPANPPSPGKNTVKAPPSGGLPGFVQFGNVPAHHWYALFTWCGSGHKTGGFGVQLIRPVNVPVFFSHCSPVALSVTVPSQLSV
jgi:hypothetical protein